MVFCAIGNDHGVSIQIDKDPIVLNGARQTLIGIGPKDVGAERVEALHETDVAVSLQGETRGQGQVPAAALTRYDNGIDVDAEFARVLVRPT